MEIIKQALKLADELEEFYEDPDGFPYLIHESATMLRQLVEELDKKQQGLVEASAMLVNYKYELDLERTMSAQLKEELEKQK